MDEFMCTIVTGGQRSTLSTTRPRGRGGRGRQEGEGEGRHAEEGARVGGRQCPLRSVLLLSLIHI